MNGDYDAILSIIVLNIDTIVIGDKINNILAYFVNLLWETNTTTTNFIFI